VSVKSESHVCDPVLECHEAAVLTIDKLASDAREYKREWHAAAELASELAMDNAQLRATVATQADAIRRMAAHETELTGKLAAIFNIADRR
jgi:chemotaxis regulatin CheY-phosphate phosphatase CheZ